MPNPPIGSHYSAKGMDAIKSGIVPLEDLIRAQKRGIRNSIWLPILCFLIFMGWGLTLIYAVCNYYGIR